MAFHDHHQIRVIVDSGAETNMIRESIAYGIGARVTKSSQAVYQADGVSPLDVRGETKVILIRDSHKLVLEALVVRGLECDVLGGVPFMEANSIGVLPHKHQITIGNDIYPYGLQAPTAHRPSIRRSVAEPLRAPTVPTVVWPGDYVEVSSPFHAFHDEPLALEPRLETKAAEQSSDQWPAPGIVGVVGGKIRIPNHTASPIVLTHRAVIGQVRPTTTHSECPSTNGDSPESTRIQQAQCIQTPFSHAVTLDPHNVLPAAVRYEFCDTLKHYESVFNPDLDKHNGASGPFQAVVNMGPVKLPQRKGRLPLYLCQNHELLQLTFDELQACGVFCHPEDANVVVEYLYPS